MKINFIIIFSFSVLLQSTFSQNKYDSSYALNLITEVKMFSNVTTCYDLNNNGKIEIIGYGPTYTHGYYYHYVKYFEREDDTTYIQTFEGRMVDGWNPQWAGDSDNDGLSELLVSWPDSVTPGYVSWFLFESRDSSSYPDTTNIIWSGKKWDYSTMYVDDLDSDGNKEFIFFDGRRKAVIIWESKGDNIYNEVVALSTGDLQYGSGLAFGDADNNGRKEIMFGSIYGEVKIWENVRDDEYELIWEGNTGVSGSYDMIYLGDMDQDGWGEYLIVGIESGYYHQLNIYEAVGDNKFVKIWGARYTESPWATATLGRGDFDGDGRDEFFFNNGAAKTRFFRAAGDNNYEVYFEAQSGPSTCSFDIDEDGQWEIMHGYGFDNPASLRLIIRRYGIVSSAEEGFSDNTYSELRAYPNPFNSSQTITYHLNQEGNLKIAIYNLLGEEVRRLKNDFSPKGEYRIHWDGKNNKGGDLSTGIYIISLVSNSSRQSIKILYMK